MVGRGEKGVEASIGDWLWEGRDVLASASGGRSLWGVKGQEEMLY